MMQSKSNLSGCTRLVEQLWRHRLSLPFRSPVDPIAQRVPDYLNIVETPMDLLTIREKLKSNQYEKQEDCIEDIRLIFSNCLLYNKSTSEISKMAKKLQSFFEVQLDKLLNSGDEDEEDMADEDEQSNIDEEDFINNDDEEEYEDDVRWTTKKRRSPMTNYEIKPNNSQRINMKPSETKSEITSPKKKSPRKPQAGSKNTSKRKRAVQFTPLYLALRDGKMEEFQTLLNDPEARSHINDRNGTTEETVLHLACSRGLQDEIKLILQVENVNLNVEDNRGFTPLNLTQAQNFSEISQMLVERGGALGEIQPDKKKKVPCRPSVASPTKPTDQARCTCCHTCRTSLTIYPREYKACSSCPYIVCKNCFESKPYIGITWEQVQKMPEWFCNVCMGNCICGRCCTRGPPRWYGHKAVNGNDSSMEDDEQNENIVGSTQNSSNSSPVSSPDAPLEEIEIPSLENSVIFPKMEMKEIETPVTHVNKKSRNSEKSKSRGAKCSCCHICRKSVNGALYKPCGTCSYVICQPCFGKRISQTWSDAQNESKWSCTVCRGICSCNRCLTRGFPAWYGSHRKPQPLGIQLESQLETAVDPAATIKIEVGDPATLVESRDVAPIVGDMIPMAECPAPSIEDEINLKNQENQVEPGMWVEDSLPWNEDISTFFNDSIDYVDCTQTV
eukprot:TRINITY_DN897_c0_g1_i1.p1 TRINITY_DN897_c0_g1~~TRINITY_DN897_c0_g1_i1.p1  ORF type:complete len:672 (-),score=180.13 TRINITY_DN897_c0_g1_i1:112-2127(-)